MSAGPPSLSLYNFRFTFSVGPDMTCVSVTGISTNKGYQVLFSLHTAPLWSPIYLNYITGWIFWTGRGNHSDWVDLGKVMTSAVHRTCWLYFIFASCSSIFIIISISYPDLLIGDIFSPLTVSCLNPLRRQILTYEVDPHTERGT